MAIREREIAKNLPMVRGLVHAVPPYFTGSVIENRLGLQVFRMLGKHFAWRLRSRKVDTEVRDHVNTLDRDGVVVLPDFLPAEDYARVRQEHDAIRARASFKSFREVDHGRLEAATFDLDGDRAEHETIRTCLQQHPLILKIASAIMRRDFTSKPSVRISVYRKVSDTAPDNDIENVLHADLHTPTVKVFYYLNDIDESNGAFTYVKGSHRISFRRLRHEYSISVRTAKLKRGDRLPHDVVAIRGPNQRAVVLEKHLGRLTEAPICGRANTLVITNNMGFHRRGRFVSDDVRETLLVNFRLFEKCFWLAPFVVGLFSNAMDISEMALGCAAFG